MKSASPPIKSDPPPLSPSTFLAFTLAQSHAHNSKNKYLSQTQSQTHKTIHTKGAGKAPSPKTMATNYANGDKADDESKPTDGIEMSKTKRRTAADELKQAGMRPPSQWAKRIGHKQYAGKGLVMPGQASPGPIYMVKGCKFKDKSIRAMIPRSYKWNP